MSVVGMTLGLALDLRAAQVQLLTYSSIWKYEPTGADQGTAWRGAAFDDSSWASGPGALGFPANEPLLAYGTVQTILPRYVSGSAGPQRPTYYLRARFFLSNAPVGLTLQATNVIDDGAVIYLNGQEVARFGLPAGVITNQTLALRADDISQHGADVANLPAHSLIRGENVVAVELHQGSVTSADVAWAMSLWANLPLEGPVRFLNSAATQTVVEGGTISLTSQVEGTGPYAIQWRKDGADVPRATNIALVIPNATVAHAGRYYMLVSNSFSRAIGPTNLIAVVPAPVQLVGSNHVWRYDDRDIDLGSTWRGTNYDDSTWPQGPGPLGFESAVLPYPIQTSISPALKLTYYFRTEFVYDAVTPDVLDFTLELDDGAAIYLNGEEVVRTGLLAGPITYNTAAERVVGDASLETISTMNSPLKLGRNVLVIEVHQTTRSSADMVMGMRVTGRFLPPTELIITNQPADLSVEEGRRAVFSIAYQGSAARVQWFRNAMPIPGANALSYSVEATSLDDAGSYSAVVSNLFFRVESRVATLGVIPDTIPPHVLGADGSLSADTIVLSFSEPLSLEATNIANYVLTDTWGGTLPVFGVRLLDATNVVMQSAPRLDGANYLVFATGLGDVKGNVIATADPVPVSTVIPLLTFDSAWDFYNPFPGLDEPDLGTEWREPAYSSADWANGRGGFWLGEFDSPVRRGEKLSQGAVTTYFRTPLDVNFSIVGAKVQLRYAIDAGAVFYIHGRETLRVNLGEAPVNYLTTAVERGLIISEPILLANENFHLSPVWLATELHASGASDGTLFFACEVLATRLSTTAGPIIFTTELADVTVAENRSVILQPIMVGAKRFQWWMNGSPIPGATNATYHIEVAAFDLQGARFQLQASNEEFSSLSRENVFAITADHERPVVLSAMGEYNQALVTFSEQAAGLTATNTLNYTVYGPGGVATVVGAQVVSATSVVVTVSRPLVFGDVVSVGGVSDISQAANRAKPTDVRIGFNSLLIGFSDRWHFDDSGLDQGTAWRGTEFDELIWPEGHGLFGMDTAVLPKPIRTPVSPSLDGGPITAYFRKRFYSPRPGAQTTLKLRMLIDDGAVFYLNGLEIHRVRVLPGQNHLTPAMTAIGDATYEGPFVVPDDNLIAGENILAVELHQTASSSDAVFGAELFIEPMAFRVLPKLWVRGLATNTIEISWDSTSGRLEQGLTPLGPWTALPEAISPYTVETQTQPSNPTFYRLKEPESL